MGVDWIPFKPKDSGDLLLIRDLAIQQAQAFKDMNDYGFYAESKQDVQNASQAQETYVAVSQQLFSLLTFGRYSEDPEYLDSRRVTILSLRRFFPHAWRQGMFATILPAELPHEMTKWRTWISRIRGGHLQHYLMQLYVHEMSRTIHGAWTALLEEANMTRQLTNPWTRKGGFQRLYSEIQSIAEPPIIQPPGRIPDLEESQLVDEHLLKRVKSIEEEAARFLRLVRLWNSIAKEYWTGWWNLGSFDSFTQPAFDPDLDDYFNWMEHWQIQGYGLYLDY